MISSNENIPEGTCFLVVCFRKEGEDENETHDGFGGNGFPGAALRLSSGRIKAQGGEESGKTLYPLPCEGRKARTQRYRELLQRKEIA